MKKQILSISAVLLLTSAMIFTSCNKEDVTAPTVTLLGDATMTIYIGETFTDPGFKATDLDGKDNESDATSMVVKTGTVDNTKSGDYVITYSATDEAGNKSTDVKRTVSVTARRARLPLSLVVAPLGAVLGHCSQGLCHHNYPPRSSKSLL